MQHVSKWCFFCLRKVWQFTAVTLVLLAVIISVLKYSLPYANQYKADFEALIAEQFGVDLYIGSISATWQNNGPALVLNNISFQPNDLAPVDLLIAQTRLQINIWQSMLDRQIRSSYFVLDGVTATIKTAELFKGQEQDTASSTGQIELIESLFLGNIGHFALENSTLELYLANGQRRTIVLEKVSWQNLDQKHQGQGRISLPGIAENSLNVIFNLYGEAFSSAFGELYVAGNKLSLAPLLAEVTPSHIKELKSDVNFELWARIDDKSVKSLQVEWLPSSLQWQYNDAAQRFSVESGSLRWQPKDNGWQLATSSLKLSANQKEWPDLGLEVSKNNGQLVGQFAHLNLAILRQFAQFEPGDTLQELIARQPTGMIEEGYFKFSDNENWLTVINAQKVGWNNIDDLPGMQDLDLNFVMQPQKGRLSVSGSDNYILTGNLFSQAISYQQLNFDLDIIKKNEQWQLKTNNFWMHNQELSLGAEGMLTLGKKNAMSLYLEVIGPPALSARQYYPRGYLPQATIDYLNGAIKGGEITQAQLLWHGALSGFPYQDQSGKFEVRAQIQQGEFQFEPSWPTITDLAAELVFSGNRMDIYSQQGQLVNLPIKDNVSVSIDDLTHAAFLTVAIDTQVEAQRLAPFFAATPLADPLESILQIVQGKGEVKGQVNLTVGLDEPNVIASGAIDLNKANIYLTQPGLPLERLQGILKFENESISLKSAKASWLGLPVEFDIVGKQQKAGYQVKVDLNANWPVEQFIGLGNGLLSGYLTEQLPLKAEVALNFPAKGFSYQADVYSDLSGLVSSLPEPFIKTAQQKWQLKGQVRGDDISNLITVGIDNKLYFNGILANDTGTLTHAHIIVGEHDLGLNQKDFDVSVDLKQANLNQWIPFIDHLLNVGDASTNSGLLPPLVKVQGTIDQADLSGVLFNELDFKLDNLDQAVEIKLMGKELRSQVSIPKVLAQRPINIDTDYLRINLPSAASEPAIANENSGWLKNLPAIRFQCGDCRIDQYQLDKVQLNLDPATDGIMISDLIIDKGKHNLVAKGAWQAGQTKLAGQFSSSDIGELFDEYDLTSSIKDSKAQTTFNLAWVGTPYEFDAKSLTGQLQLDLGEGHLTEVSDGGARVFSLLSLDSLVRKLKLDFRDVFAKGFFYNSLKGSMQIENGIATTKNTKIDGVPADISIAGYANLTTKEINYNLAVAPEVTSSLPVLLGWLAGPVPGLAALAIDKVIHSARVISEINFRIDGTMDKPVVTELGRKSREVELPQELKIPTPEANSEIK